MKDPICWLHISTRTTDGNHFKNFSQSVQKTGREGKKRKKTWKAIVTLTAFAWNTYCDCLSLNKLRTQIYETKQKDSLNVFYQENISLFNQKPSKDYKRV